MDLTLLSWSIKVFEFDFSLSLFTMLYDLPTENEADEVQTVWKEN